MSLLGINYILFPRSLAFSYMYLGSISSYWQKIILLIICIVYLFLTIYKLISNFERTKDFVQNTPNGNINISRNTLNNYISDILKQDSSIRDSKVNSFNKGKKVIVDIKTNLVSKVNVVDKVRDLKELIKNEVKENIGLDIGDIRLNIAKVEIPVTNGNDFYQKEETVYNTNNPINNDEVI